jgi:hypothetical protein
MAERSYFLDLFTPQTWDEFTKAGSTISGFREARWSYVQKIQKGDYLLCYLTGVGRWVGILEVTSNKSFRDDKPIWKDDVFPCRVKVKSIVSLDPETAVPVRDMKDVLSAFKTAKSDSYSLAWTGRFRGSPAKWSQSDGEAVLQAVLSAKKNPVKRPIDPAKLKYRPKAAIATKIGLVTVPDSEPTSESEKLIAGDSPKEITAHTEIQSLLLQLGSEMGFEIWVAKNDRSKTHNGVKFADLPKMKESLPLQFEEATREALRRSLNS